MDAPVEPATRDVAGLLRAIRAGDVPATQRPVDLRGAALAGEDLGGVDLSGVDLSGADLGGADLSGALLFRANLSNTVLIRAVLCDAELTAADLTGAELEHADLARAGLGQATLVGARLFEANLEGATLSLADLTGADLRCARLVNARIREADLTRADFTEADLRHAELSLSHVAGATFNNADMRDVRLRLVRGYAEASWVGTDLRDVNFAGAYRIRRFINDQNYIKEYRESSRLSGLLYYAWWLTADCGRSMLRWCVLIFVLALLFAGLYSFVDIDYGDHPTWLAPLYFSVVTMTSLGFGDVVPASPMGQVLVMAEVTIGYVMLGGLISIFSNRIARRAD